jgi:hypothetical protein
MHKRPLDEKGCALGGEGIQVGSASRLGHPEAEIIACAIAAEANVILTSGHGPGGPAATLSDGVSRRLSMSGAKAVLPVRPGGQT